MTILRLALATALCLCAASSPAAAKPKIVANGDLPTKRYDLGAPPSKAWTRDAFVRDTLPILRADAEKILADYDIENALIRARLHQGLAAIAILQNRPHDAERLLADERALQAKPQLRAIGFLMHDAVAAGLAVPAEKRCDAMAARISERLKVTDPLIVRDEVLLRLGQTEAYSIPYLGAGAAVEFDPLAEKTGGIDILDTMLLAIWRAGVEYIPPCRSRMTDAFRSWANDPANRPVDIWPARQPDPAAFARAAPVTVAIWDTGIDTTMFAGQMAYDPAEPFDGKDNDGNGVVDDIYGPTYDFRGHPSHDDIAPPSAFLKPQLGFQMALYKGQRDMNYGLDTPEAALMARRSREAGLAEQEGDIDAMNELGDRGHGTFVASQVADGAPYVRLYNNRVVIGGYDPKPIAIGEDENRRWLAAVPASIARMKRAGVRVVNMSWVVTVDGIVEELLIGGFEKDETKARARAQAIYREAEKVLKQALDDARDILFVAGAGNNNQSDKSFAAVPQSIDAPNLIVVGAVGLSGAPAGFTTFGEGVDIYGPGEAVRGRMPGGAALSGSGTSYASPNVARAAAQMLAVNPDLNPAQLIEGLLATASVGDSGVKLVNPAAAVAWAEKHR